MAPNDIPHDVDAEKNVLGAILRDPDAVHHAVSVLGDNSTVFHKGAHQLIYGAAVRLAGRSDPVDIYTVASELKRRDELSRAGTVAYLYEIEESVPNAANVEYYAQIVREKAVRRALIEAGTRIIQESARDDVALDDVLDQAQRAVFGVNRSDRRGFADLGQVLGETMSYIEDLYKRKDALLGVPTGLPDLDRLLAGLSPADLIIVAARPAMGKSSFAHNVLSHVAFRERRPAALFTLEMGREQILMRLLATESRTDMHRVRTGSLSNDDWTRLGQAASRIEGAPLYLNDAPGLSIMEVRAESRRLKMRHPDLAVVVVDYLQLLHGGTRTAQTREQEISEYSRFLKELARDLDVCVMALSQLNRAVENRPDKRPQLADLRESGAIEQDADIVMFLYREDYYTPDAANASGVAELIVRKHRNGPLGTVMSMFHPKYLLFESLEDVK
jgi:replicative DNA helicase